MPPFHYDKEPQPTGFNLEVSGISVTVDPGAARILAALSVGNQVLELPVGEIPSSNPAQRLPSASDRFRIDSLTLSTLPPDSPPYIPPEGWEKLEYTRVDDPRVGRKGVLAAVSEKVTSSPGEHGLPRRDLHLIMLDLPLEADDPRRIFLAQAAAFSLGIGLRGTGARADLMLLQQLGHPDSPESQAVDQLASDRRFLRIMGGLLGFAMLKSTIRNQELTLRGKFREAKEILWMGAQLYRGPDPNASDLLTNERVASFEVVKAIADKAAQVVKPGSM